MWIFSFFYNNINDLVINIKCMVKYFVDDILFYIVVYNVDILVCLFNNDFE